MDDDLIEFKKKIENFKNKDLHKNVKIGDKNSNFSFAFKISVDFVATIIVSILIGIGLDKIFSTKPIFFLIFLIFGLAAAFMNIYRTVLNIEKHNKEK